MSDTIDDIEDDVDIEHSNIGRRAYFVQPHQDPEQVFDFSSTIEGIGVDHDRKLKNHSEVLVISEQQDAVHPVVGKLAVIKVIAGQDMWLPVNSLVIIKEPI